ncbi:MAG: type II and III secretion system protein [Bryobacteraceae bacterium]
MSLRILVCALLAFACFAGADPTAARLARKAHEAQESGQLVRAYLLYAEAAARDPHNPSYRANRDALAPAAQLLTKANIESADVSADIKDVENEPSREGPPVEIASRQVWERDEHLQSLPHIQADSSLHDLDIRTNETSLFEQVAGAYGVRAIWDSQLQPEPSVHLQIAQADFHTAMEALTAATHTFVFPITEHLIFFARDTEAKRSELEPNILLTFPLPNALDQKDLIEAASAVRGALKLRSIGWDSFSRVVMIRDRVSLARIARSLLEAVLLPKGQVSIELEFLTVDTDRSYHYGIAMPTTFSLVDFGHVGGFQSVLAAMTGPAGFLTFGAGATLFGIGTTTPTLFATYSESLSRHLYDATVAVGDGQTANFHIGDKYPIPQTLYTGFQQTGGSIYNPIGQVTFEDLGLILKLIPHVSGDGDISLDVDAEVKSLGTQTYDTVPAIDEREFKGSITLREGQWAVIAGLDAINRSVTRNGLAGLSSIPGLKQLLSENTRDTNTSKTLLVIKPTITRLPMSESISPQYFVGSQHGERVVL